MMYRIVYRIVALVPRYVSVAKKMYRCSPRSYCSPIGIYVIAWARGQLRINFTRIFKVFAKLPESRSDEDNLENFENASEINP